MIHPIPSGTRDVLPDEMRELRAITEAIRGVFESSGYGEIATPALEYEEVLTRGDPRAADPAYKLFDEHGERARAALGHDDPDRARGGEPLREPPSRRCASAYFAHAYRSVRPQRGQAREMLQAGLELVGAPGPDGTAEALSVLCAGLDAAGLENYRIGLGDASLYRAPARPARPCPRARGRRSCTSWSRATSSGSRARSRRTGTRSSCACRSCAAAPRCWRGSREAGELRAVYDLLAPEVAERVIFDLGLIRDLDYYTGAVFEVYDAALGAPLGGGGRYDDLLGRFGRDLPACGWALNVERLHIARVGEGR